MPDRFTRDADPFSNETKLLKRIALFQRKARELGHANSKCQKDMRELYLQVVAECRLQLDGFSPTQASPSDRVSMDKNGQDSLELVVQSRPARLSHV